MYTLIGYLLFIIVFVWNDGSVNYVMLAVDIHERSQCSVTVAGRGYSRRTRLGGGGRLD